MNSIVLFLLTAFVMSVYAIPPQGCTSCLLAPIEPHTKNCGRSEVTKALNDHGCFVQRLFCMGNTLESETFVQFNYGKSGFFSKTNQTVEITCNQKGEWQVEESGVTLIVESMACLST